MPVVTVAPGRSSYPEEKSVPTSGVIPSMQPQANELPLPRVLVELLLQKAWPKGRLSTSRLAGAAPFLSRVDLELLHEVESMRAELGTLLQFVDSYGLSDSYKLKRGSKVSEAIELPWLDVEQAVCIGGGADLGADTWLILDYRINPNDPRVVANEFQSGKCNWREVAPSLSEFCRIMGITDGSYESADPEPISDEILRQLRWTRRSSWPTLLIQMEPPGVYAQEVEGEVVMCSGGKATELHSGDKIDCACILKLAGGSKLVMARDGRWICKHAPVGNGVWIEMRPGQFSRGFEVSGSSR